MTRESFSGKVVLITGASSGIGLACAKQFASLGASLALAARRFVDLCEVSAALEKEFNIRAVAVAADVSDETSCKNFIAQAHVTFGRIDVLINNAGISMRASVQQVETSVLKRLMDVNFWGTVYCTKYALPFILENRGVIVGVSSIAGFKGLPGRAGYSASKFALQGFLEVVRLETLQKGVQVLTVCPGFTASNIRRAALDGLGNEAGETNRNETQMMTAEVVASQIAAAVLKRKRILVLTFQGKLLYVLNKFFPAVADRLVYRSFAREEGSVISS